MEAGDEQEPGCSLARIAKLRSEERCTRRWRVHSASRPARIRAHHSLCGDHTAAGGREYRGRDLGHPGLPPRCRSRSEEHTSELQSRVDLVCRLLLEKKKK